MSKSPHQQQQGGEWVTIGPRGRPHPSLPPSPLSTALSFKPLEESKRDVKIISQIQALFFDRITRKLFAEDVNESSTLAVVALGSPCHFRTSLQQLAWLVHLARTQKIKKFILVEPRLEREDMELIADVLSPALVDRVETVFVSDSQSFVSPSLDLTSWIDTLSPPITVFAPHCPRILALELGQRLASCQIRAMLGNDLRLYSQRSQENVLNQLLFDPLDEVPEYLEVSFQSLAFVKQASS